MTTLAQRLQTVAVRTIQDADLQAAAIDLNPTQIWMMWEVAGDINAMTETGDMTAVEAQEVLGRLAGILGRVA